MRQVLRDRMISCGLFRVMQDILLHTSILNHNLQDESNIVMDYFISDCHETIIACREVQYKWWNNQYLSADSKCYKMGN